MKMYQSVTVSKSFGIPSVIPSPYVFTTADAAYQDVMNQKRVFGDHGQEITYKGHIRGLNQIADLCMCDAAEGQTVDVYIIDLEVRV